MPDSLEIQDVFYERLALQRKVGYTGIKFWYGSGRKGMSERRREAFIDILRVAATCAVVMLHAVTGIMDVTDMTLYPVTKKVFLIVLDLVCWCVPVFVMISGYLFLNPKKEISFRLMLTRYCRRILAALFVFGIPYAWLEQAAVKGTFGPEMILEGVLMVFRGESWSHLWYLYMIFFLYLITPAVKWLLKRLPLPAVFVFLIALFLGSSVLPYARKLFGLEWMAVLPDGAIYFFYYICGYLFAVYRDGGICKRKSAPRACLGFRRMLPFLAAALAGGMAASRLSGKYIVQMAYNYPFTVLLSLLLFAVGLEGNRDGGQEKINAVAWEKAGALCFAVYLIHPLFLNIYYKFLHISPLDFFIGVSLPVFFLAILLPAFFSAWILRKIPPLRKWVL